MNRNVIAPESLGLQERYKLFDGYFELLSCNYIGLKTCPQVSVECCFLSVTWNFIGELFLFPVEELVLYQCLLNLDDGH